MSYLAAMIYAMYVVLYVNVLGTISQWRNCEWFLQVTNYQSRSDTDRHSRVLFMKSVNLNNLTQLNALFLITQFYYNRLDILNFNNLQNLWNQAIYCIVIIFSCFFYHLSGHTFFLFCSTMCFEYEGIRILKQKGIRLMI